MFGGKYNPERWIGLSLFILGVFYLGYFWPRQNVIHRSTSIFSNADTEKNPALSPFENRLNNKAQDIQELSKTLLPESDLIPLTLNPSPARGEGSSTTSNNFKTPNFSNSQHLLPSPLAGEGAGWGEHPNLTKCHVLVVFDGDTLGCDINGNGKLNKPEEEIRLLGIDSPEMHYSKKNPSYQTAHPKDEPFAKEASQWLTQQVTGKTLYLESDLKPFDRYGRRLAYIYASPSSKESLNEQALRTGYYQTLFLGKNRRYQTQFENALQEAQTHHLGLWKSN